MNNIKSLWGDTLKQESKENAVPLRDVLEAAAPPWGRTDTHGLRAKPAAARHSGHSDVMAEPAAFTKLLDPLCASTSLWVSTAEDFSFLMI